MKAEYYDKNQVWIVKLKDKEFNYPIELVTVELVEYWAKLKDKIGKDVGWESLSAEDKKHLLDWFEKEVFPSKEFGEFLIDELTNEALQVITQQEEEQRIEIPSFSDIIKQTKGSYLEYLEGQLSPYFSKGIVSTIAKEHYLDREGVRIIAEKIINEWDEKGELNSRLEAIKLADTYAIEDLRNTLIKEGYEKFFSEILEYLKTYPLKE